MDREPLGEELLAALVALRDGTGDAKAAWEIVYRKLRSMWVRKVGFVGVVDEDTVVEACLKAVRSEFRGESPGEAVRWLSSVARTVSLDVRRREKRRREGALRLVPAEPEPHEHTPAVGFDEDDVRAFLVELRDVQIGAFSKARYPKRSPRESIELAYLAAVEREDYLAELEACADEKERQRLQKQMGRGRDELWLPFLEELAGDASLEEWQLGVVRELTDALVGTRRRDHGRARGGAA